MPTITKQQLDNSPGGIHAKFVDLGEYGMKIYRAELARDAQFANQTKLEEYGLAVKCWDCFDFEGPTGETLYAFYTEKVRTYHGCSGYSRCKGCEKCAEKAEFQQAMSDLCSLLSDHGIEWEDDHLGNIGIDSEGDPVLIDCDFCYSDDLELTYVGCGECEEWGD